MAPRLKRLPRDAPIDRVMAAIERDGAVILEGMLAAREIVAIIEELTPFLDTAAAGRESFSGFRTTRTGALAARSAKVGSALQDPRILAICDRVLLPNCER